MRFDSVSLTNDGSLEYVKEYNMAEKVAEKAERHPCYSNSAHYHYARIHLPVARKCNMSCNYCDRKFCRNDGRENERPGVAERVVKPEEVVEYINGILSKIPAETTVLGIAGPGEPLYNKETFETLKIVSERYPEVFRCLATNGVLLEDKLDRLLECDITHLTITINAVNPVTAAKIYRYVRYRKKYEGVEAGELILERQYAGLREAANAGILVKINTVLIPGINDREVVAVAREVSRYAYVMNVMPLIPLGRFSKLRKPTYEEVARVRMAAGKYIRQFYHCRACRADAFGVPGSLCFK